MANISDEVDFLSIVYPVIGEIEKWKYFIENTIESKFCWMQSDAPTRQFQASHHCCEREILVDSMATCPDSRK